MLKLKIIKLRNISFSNMDFEILKAAMLTSKSTMLKGDDVTTEKMPGKMSPGGGNNAKANEWNFCSPAYVILYHETTTSKGPIHRQHSDLWFIQ